MGLNHCSGSPMYKRTRKNTKVLVGLCSEFLLYGINKVCYEKNINLHEHFTWNLHEFSWHFPVDPLIGTCDEVSDLGDHSNLAVKRISRVDVIFETVEDFWYNNSVFLEKYLNSHLLHTFHASLKFFALQIVNASWCFIIF